MELGEISFPDRCHSRSGIYTLRSIPQKPVPLGNLDVFEDVRPVINWLFFAIPLFVGDSLRLFLFFEENSFLKDDAGDLVLVSSPIHTFHC